MERERRPDQVAHLPPLQRSIGERLMADKTDKPEKQEKAKRQGDQGGKGGGPKAQGGDKGQRKKGGAPQQAAPAAPEKPREPEPKIPARMRLKFEAEILPILMRELKIENKMRVPRLTKIVINMGLGEARDNIKLLEAALEELTVIAGQKPVMTKARKAISNFKLRENVPIGVMVTLRRERMWEFFDRLVNVALPRVRDFHGIGEKSFDGRGNYSLGLREHTIFPELNLDKIEKVKGLTITFGTTARSDFEGLTLLRTLGMPFRNAAGDRSTAAAAAA
jgi:large subunit ribosomal protein L5